MTDPHPAPRRARFVLSAPPPVRALAIAAGTAVVGVLLLVLAELFGWPGGIAVLGVVVLVLGVALAVLAVLTTSRLRTVVETDPDQVSVTRRGRTVTASWSDVKEVTVVGHRLTLTSKAGAPPGVTVLNPRARANPVFLGLMTDIQQRLDANRGYTPFG